MGRDYQLRKHGAPPEGSAACQSSKVGNSLPLHADPSCYPGGCLLQIERYKNGDRVKWPALREPPKPPEERERASIQQSTKSRLHSAFQLGNAETNWLAMTTLTYRVAPSSYGEVRDHWTRFKDRLRKRFDGAEWGWILEFQRRGAAHYHVFLGDGGELGEAIKREQTRERMRHGNKVEILAGPVASFIEDAWIDIVGDDDPRFKKVQKGGIVEKMRTPDAAGRYAAKEAAKRVQKVAPWPVSQWWGMSKSIQPIMRARKAMSVDEYRMLYPDLPVCSRLWEHAEIS